jgi:hypothetical protein
LLPGWYVKVAWVTFVTVKRTLPTLFAMRPVATEHVPAVFVTHESEPL